MDINKRFGWPVRPVAAPENCISGKNYRFTVLTDRLIRMEYDPMGIFEDERFAKGTIEVCKAITETNDCFTVIGGGDSAAAAAQLGFKEKFSHVSTGGGASLEMIENDGHLPGIDIIQDK